MVATERELLFVEIDFVLRWYSGNIVSDYSYETSLTLYMMAYSMVLSRQRKSQYLAVVGSLEHS